MRYCTVWMKCLVMGGLFRTLGLISAQQNSSLLQPAQGVMCWNWPLHQWMPALQQPSGTAHVPSPGTGSPGLLPLHLHLGGPPTSLPPVWQPSPTRAKPHALFCSAEFHKLLGQSGTCNSKIGTAHFRKGKERPTQLANWGHRVKCAVHPATSTLAGVPLHKLLWMSRV